MDKSVKNILSQVYELEGLLLLVDNHAQNTDSYVYELIRDKANIVAKLSEELTPNIFIESVDQEMSQDADVEADESPEYECLGADSCCDTGDDYEDEPVEMIQPEEEIEDEAELQDESPEDVVEIEEDDDDEPMELSSLDDDTQIEFIDEIDEDDLDSKVNEIVDEAEDAAYEVDAINEANEDYVAEEEEVADDEIEAPITLDTVLSRSMSKNLRQAFTLNDRFRYRRELFGNSDVEMTNTLNLVEAMGSYSEAEDYFYGDMEWDKESPEVVDFMTIIHNHFA